MGERELARPREDMSDLAPVHEIAAVEEGHAREILKRARHEEVVLPEAADARVRFEGGNDRIRDDSLRLKPRASGMTLVCRPTPTVRFMSMSELALKATHALHGTTDERGSIFTPNPAPGNPPKRSLVAIVQKSCLDSSTE
jgi:hypothetical protein